MKESDNPQSWIEVAEQDLGAIQALSAAAQPYHKLICFLAQQAGEKYLKAYLLHKGLPPPHTHDLRALLGVCALYDGSLAALKDECSRLTAEAVASRYPGPTGERDENDATQAVTIAQSIRSEIRKRLGM